MPESLSQWATLDFWNNPGGQDHHSKSLGEHLGEESADWSMGHTGISSWPVGHSLDALNTHIQDADS